MSERGGETSSAGTEEHHSNLFEYLEGCHHHLHSSLAIPRDCDWAHPPGTTTTLQPKRIRPWDDFGERQTALWGTLLSTDFPEERNFDILATLETEGETIRADNNFLIPRDIGHFMTDSVINPVRIIVEEMWNNRELMRGLNLHSGLYFTNSQLLADPDPENDPAKEGKGALNLDAEPQLSNPKIDQFCVHNGKNGPKYVFGLQYLVPKVLSVDHLVLGLQDEIDVDDIVRTDPDEDIRRQCQRYVAALVSKAYTQMILGRMRYSCISTGEAFIFLHVPKGESTCVEYFLSVPQMQANKAGPSTPNWHLNILHLTAVGQMLAFTLYAIQDERYDFAWMVRATERLKMWKFTILHLHKDLEAGKQQLQDAAAECKQRPPRENLADFMTNTVLSPIRRQRRRTMADQRLTYDEDSWMPYCSMACLKGLVDGRALDLSCPNAHDHRSGSGENAVAHPIDLAEFQRLVGEALDRQLVYCGNELHVFNAQSQMYRIHLPRWGYTVIGKGARSACQSMSKHEERVYTDRFGALQGVCVPVYLGSFELTRPLRFLGIVRVIHMMVFSHCGTSVFEQRVGDAEDRAALVASARQGLRAIHAVAVLHNDISLNNILWDRLRGTVLWVDFGKSIINSDSMPQLKAVKEDWEWDAPGGYPEYSGTEATNDNNDVKGFTRAREDEFRALASVLGMYFAEADGRLTD